MLEIVDALAKLAARRTQQAQRLGMVVEKVRMTAEIGHDIAPADFGQGSRHIAIALGLRLVAGAVDHAAQPARREGERERASNATTDVTIHQHLKSNTRPPPLPTRASAAAARRRV
jgi:hypothetical protein